MKKLNHSFLIATILSAAFATACANSEAGSGSGDGSLGQLEANLTLGDGATYDVTSAHFAVVPAGGSCTDIPIAETTGLIETEALQGNLDPAETPTGRAFIDGLMVLPPGTYMVCVTPLQENGLPSEQCDVATGEITVIPEVVSEVVLVSQCEGDPNGGIDVVGVLNGQPLITDLNIGPSKFITTCETASLEVQAEDPNGDAMSYDWEIISGPGGGLLIETGATAQFTPDAAGDYELKVTVTDATGASASMTFPVHVSEAEGSCDPVACPAGTFDAAGFCWVVAADFQDGEQSCGEHGLIGPYQDAEGVEWTPEMMAEVTAAMGCTNLGSVSGTGAPSLFFDSAQNECLTQTFSDDAGQPYVNSGAPLAPGQAAVHLCDRPE
jgi:hypothetical protein